MTARRVVVAGVVTLVTLSTVLASQTLQAPPATVFLLTGVNPSALYHRQGCPWLLEGSGLVYMPRVEADARYYRAHELCVLGQERTPPQMRPADRLAALPTTSPTAASRAVVSTLTAPRTVSTPAVAAPVRTPPPTSAARVQCAATTQRGARCKRLASVGSAYCWQHQR
jgi:hypothetical protein